MRVAISQPEHFPYLGYFQKMSSCDVFVILDHVQFSGPRSFQNRNRFTNKNGEMEWFTVPVAKNSYFEPINCVKTAPDYGWRKKLIKKMEYNFRGVNFEEIYSFDTLMQINMASIEYCREAFGINTPIIYSSSLNVDGSKSSLIYNICKLLEAKVYITGSGGATYLNQGEFTGIEIEYLENKGTPLDSSIVYASGNNGVKIESLF